MTFKNEHWWKVIPSITIDCQWKGRNWDGHTKSLHWSMFASACQWQRRLTFRYSAGFLEQNGSAHDKLTEMSYNVCCTRWYVFLFCINVNRQAISLSLSWALSLCSRKPAMYLTASLRCHRQADVNIDLCATSLVKISFTVKTNCIQSP